MRVDDILNELYKVSNAGKRRAREFAEHLKSKFPSFREVGDQKIRDEVVKAMINKKLGKEVVSYPIYGLGISGEIFTLNEEPFLVYLADGWSSVCLGTPKFDEVLRRIREAGQKTLPS